ncbi:hypothetical protein [Bradyrhizobium sp.]|uniref:hypothetical protein n=1 Tax=Bradyrhizobium sp. TaxID=376 RepID=UPI0026262169|nr:hypothetical protein [Bradyrhizobium sp.]
MREVSLPKVDEKGNHIPDDSTPTKEELRRDLDNGTRVISVQQDRMNEFHVGEDPNGDLDGDLFRAVLAEAAETNIAAQVALEYWDEGRNKPDSPHTVRDCVNDDGVIDWEKFKAGFDNVVSSIPRKVRRQTKLDDYKMTLALNLLGAMGSVALGEEFQSKAQSVISYGFGRIEWDELLADLEGRQCVRGQWKKSRVGSTSKQTRH